MYRLIKLIPFLILVGLANAQNRALFLNGHSAYIQLPEPIMTDLSFSIEAWYMVVGEGGGTEQQNYIFSQRDDDTGCNQSSVSFAAKA